MGNTPLQRVNFEDVQSAQQGAALIINVMHENEQAVLIAGTVKPCDEVEAVNDALRRKFPIIVYGRHANDVAAEAKCAQLRALGSRSFLYAGGLFEWLMLQDIFGAEQFSTTGNKLDLLDFITKTVLTKRYLTM
jgi:rhodanese-related sulfurtransferase